MFAELRFAVHQWYTVLFERLSSRIDVIEGLGRTEFALQDGRAGAAVGHAMASKRAIDDPSTRGDGLRKVWSAFYLSMAWQYLGSFSLAAQAAEEAATWARLLDDDVPNAWASQRLIEVWEAQGEFTRASRAYAETIEQAERARRGGAQTKSRRDVLIMHGRTRQAACEIKGGNFDAGEALLERTVDARERERVVIAPKRVRDVVRDQWAQVDGLNLRWRAIAAIRQGRLDVADELLFKSLKVSPPWRMNDLLFGFALSHLLAARGDADAGRVLAETATEAADSGFVTPAFVATDAVVPLLRTVDE